MTLPLTVQPRHTKLGLARQEKNWVYAAYALYEQDLVLPRPGFPGSHALTIGRVRRDKGP